MQLIVTNFRSVKSDIYSDPLCSADPFLTLVDVLCIDSANFSYRSSKMILVGYTICQKYINNYHVIRIP